MINIIHIISHLENHRCEEEVSELRVHPSESRVHKLDKVVEDEVAWLVAGLGPICGVLPKQVEALIRLQGIKLGRVPGHIELAAREELLLLV
eukprot:563760-Amorphochlora_amoeboformis.AAC.1